MKSIKTSLCTALLASALSINSFASDCTYELFTISSSKETRIIDFIEQLSDECSFSIIVTDPHAQKFLQRRLNRLNLKNLTLDEVLDIVLEENNLSYSLKNNILKISYLTTKIFNIDYILSQRKSVGSTDVTLSSSGTSTPNKVSASGGSTEGASGRSTGASSDTGIKIESTDEVKFWEQLDSEFRSVLNRPHDTYKASAPIINKNAGLITVTATASQLKRFEKYLKRLQEKVQLQVLIDVQLLSVTMKKGKTTGIDWRQLYALQNIDIALDRRNWQNVSEYSGNEITQGMYSNASAIGQMVTIKANAKLNEVIKFLKTQGDVNSISNPKVLTLNNQPALITAGTEYFYKIKSETQQQGAVGGIAATTQNDNIQSVFAGVLLTITPEISNDNTITLKINPSLSETTTDLSQVSNIGREMPPDLNRRELSSVVTVKDGNRIILGGLINTRTINDTSKVPILGDIPIIDSLFKYETKTREVQELVIIIEPHIIHKEKNTISLSDLGYDGIDNSLLTDEFASKKKKKQHAIRIDTNTSKQKQTK